MRIVRVKHKSSLLKALILGAFFFSPHAHAGPTSRTDAGTEIPQRQRDFDYSLSFGARSQPAGAAVFADFGYNHPLWGDWVDRENVYYGYVRPGIRLASSGLINGGDAFVSVYPVSFLGLTAGRSYSYRARDYSRAVDCNLYECGGELTAPFTTIDLLFGLKNYFYVGQADSREWHSTPGEQDFYEDGSGVIGQRGGDRIFSHTHTIGVRLLESQLLDDFFVGVSAKRAESKDLGGYSERYTLVGGHRHGPLKWTYAAGVYQSTVVAPSLHLAFLVEWVRREGLAL